MKIQNNVTVFAGDTENSQKSEKTGRTVARETESQNRGRGNNRTIYAGNFLREISLKDRIAERKAQAQERAMKIINDAWEGDKKLDKEIEENQERIQELRQDSKEALECGDYSAVAENVKQIAMANETIKGIRGERRKYHTMADAQDEAEDIMASAREDILSIAVEEAREHIDEEQEKREEQAEAIQERKEEQEEIPEEREEKEEELKELVEEMPVKEAADVDQTMAEVKRQVQNVLNQAHLVDEDMKGARVDLNV